MPESKDAEKSSSAGISNVESTGKTAPRRNPINGIRLIVATVIVGVSMGFVLNEFLTASPIEIKIDDLDFGTAWVQDDLRFAIPITNTSAKGITVRNIKAGCTCTILEATSFSIDPHATVSIPIRINLTEYRSRQVSEFDRSATKVKIPLSVSLDGNRGKPKNWIITGIARPAIMVNSNAIRFGTIDAPLTPHSMPSEQLVRIDADATIREVIAQGDTSFFNLSITQSVTRKSSFDLRIKPKVDGEVRKDLFTINLHGITTDGNRTPPLPIYSTVHMVSDIEVLPNVITFGKISIGQEAKRSFSVIPYTKSWESVYLVPSDQIESSKIMVHKNPGNFNYEVAISPRKRGTFDDTVILTFRNADGDIVRLPLRVHAYVVDPSRVSL